MPDSYTPPQDETRRRLVDQYTEIARLAGGLAHEIKNPLSTIRLNMDLLAEDFQDADSPRERRALRRVRTVQDECQRLQDLLDDFLRYTRMRDLQRRPLDLNEQLAEVLDFYQAKAAQAGIEVVEYLASDLPAVLLDAEAFRGAMLNLILNAEQAMPEGGELLVRTYATADGVGIDLIDTGCGMDDDTLDRIFQAFYSTKSGGSGLGLPTARRIIEAHGGSIDAQSAPGHGTRFTIRLPVPPRLER